MMHRKSNSILALDAGEIASDSFDETLALYRAHAIKEIPPVFYIKATERVEDICRNEAYVRKHLTVDSFHTKRGKADAVANARVATIFFDYLQDMRSRSRVYFSSFADRRFLLGGSPLKIKLPPLAVLGVNGAPTILIPQFRKFPRPTAKCYELMKYLIRSKIASEDWASQNVQLLVLDMSALKVSGPRDVHLIDLAYVRDISDQEANLRLQNLADAHAQLKPEDYAPVYEKPALESPQEPIREDLFSFKNI